MMTPRQAMILEAIIAHTRECLDGQGAAGRGLAWLGLARQDKVF